jgi:hypothetical protein
VFQDFDDELREFDVRADLARRGGGRCVPSPAPYICILPPCLLIVRFVLSQGRDSDRWISKSRGWGQSVVVVVVVVVGVWVPIVFAR